MASDEKSPPLEADGMAAALRRQCRYKCGGPEPMDLGNHVTAFNALRNMPPPHRDNFKRMGYSYLCRESEKKTCKKYIF